jgi:hypothetical protein
MWRGRLPHWRAEGEVYYVTFKHRRALEESERTVLLSGLLRGQRRKLDLLILCVLPAQTDMLFRIERGPDGEEFELSDVVEKAKRKAGKDIIKKSGERFPPFWTESFDRIMRDEEELQTFWQAIFEGSSGLEEPVEPEEYEWLWVAEPMDSP